MVRDGGGQVRELGCTVKSLVSATSQSLIEQPVRERERDSGQETNRRKVNTETGNTLNMTESRISQTFFFFPISRLEATGIAGMDVLELWCCAMATAV